MALPSPMLGSAAHDAMLDRTLSVFLPVHNAQSQLAELVTKTLDILPDLTKRFEVLIVDDGSHDDTPEVAHDLARQFPQVQVIRHGRRLGREAAIQSGLAHSEGDIILSLDASSAMDLREIDQLWRQIDRNHVVLSSFTKGRGGRIGRLLRVLAAWAQSRLQSRRQADADGGAEMIHRSAISPLGWPLASRRQLLARLAEAGYDWDEVPLFRRKKSAMSRGKPPTGGLCGMGGNSRNHSGGARQIGRPAYLAKIKNFALGE